MASWPMKYKVARAQGPQDWCVIPVLFAPAAVLSSKLNGLPGHG